MHYFLDALSIFLLSLIAYEDFKHRAISWYLLPVLGIVFLAASFRQFPLSEIATEFFINFSFVAAQLLLLTVYFSIKERKPVNIIKKHIGMGDILFFIALCAAFSPVNFLVFYVSGLAVTLLGAGIYHLLSRKSIMEIPLAGGFAVLLIIGIFSGYFIGGIRFHDDTFTLKLLGF